jgi:hypothetical protein
VKTLIAIDPGARGAIACLGPTADWQPMPETAQDLALALGSYCPCDSRTLLVYLEQVSGFAGERHPGSAMFTFGRGFGRIEGVLSALRIPFVMVTPQRWQKALGCPTRAAASDKASHKRALREMAQRLYPHINVTLQNADALLLLEYARRQENLAAPVASQERQLLTVGGTL